MSVNFKLYFVTKYNFPDTDYPELSAAQIVAMFDMGTFGYDKWQMDFIDCFFCDTPFPLYVSVCDKESGNWLMKNVLEDDMGGRFSYASSNKELYECAKAVYKNEPCERFGLLKEILKAFKDNEDIYIVLAGY